VMSDSGPYAGKLADTYCASCVCWRGDRASPDTALEASANKRTERTKDVMLWMRGDSI